MRNAKHLAANPAEREISSQYFGSFRQLIPFLDTAQVRRPTVQDQVTKECYDDLLRHGRRLPSFTGVKRHD